jgi:hypothetical protein
MLISVANVMEYGLSLEAYSRRASREIIRLLWKTATWQQLAIEFLGVWYPE